MNWQEVLRLKSLSQHNAPSTYVRLTVVDLPPERICATDLAMDGFSATHKTRICYTKVTVAFLKGVSKGEILVAGSTNY